MKIPSLAKLLEEQRKDLYSAENHNCVPLLGSGAVSQRPKDNRQTRKHGDFTI
jgi:hypothetical protein